METLNYKQCAFLLNLSEDAALNIFIRYLRPEQTETLLPGTVKLSEEKKDRRDRKKQLRESLKGETLSIEQLNKHFNFDVSLLMSSINERFFKSKECLDYLERHFKEKYKPDKYGFYPQSMSAPAEVTSFMNEENKERLREWFKGRYMSGPAEARIECILKFK